ncbi:MAG: hypothetical protein NTZ67_05380 [Gammaproteobacteria bacterium]|nr:hypothetical protein [Gammaproteobacteria bacterium]
MIYGGKFGIGIFLVILTVTFFYCLTLTRVLKCIPQDKQKFPAWFVWLFLIPIVGYIFQWIMLPFGIPAALKKHFSTNQDAIEQAETLFKIGLAQVILEMVSIFVFIPPINDISSLLGFSMLIFYWVKILKFKKTYFPTCPK